MKILYVKPYLEKYFPLCKVCASISIQEDAIGDLPRPVSVSCQATPRPRSPNLKKFDKEREGGAQSPPERKGGGEGLSPRLREGGLSPHLTERYPYHTLDLRQKLLVSRLNSFDRIQIV